MNNCVQTGVKQKRQWLKKSLLCNEFIHGEFIMIQSSSLHHTFHTADENKNKCIVTSTNRTISQSQGQRNQQTHKQMQEVAGDRKYII